MRETLRFKSCSTQLWEILHQSNSEINTSYCAVIFSDFPLADSIPICGKIIVKNEGRCRLGILQTHQLSVSIPKSLDPFDDFCFSEALSSLLSFSFRSRFQASRHHCRYDKNGNLCEPMDAFLRVTSHWASLFTSKCPSLQGIKERNIEVQFIINLLKKMNYENFETLLKSFRLYQLAQLTHSVDVGLAYSLLVSSVDSISCTLYKDFKKGGNTAKFIKFIEDFLPSEFWSSFDSRAVEEDRYRQRLFQDMNTKPDFSILEHERKMYEKEGKTNLDNILNDFAIKRLEKVFKDKEEMPLEEKEAYEHVLKYWYLYGSDSKLSKAELSGSLKGIYENVRSAFFHSGKSPSEGAFDDYETAKIKLRITNDNKMITQRDIPSFYWFERIAHDCILNYLTKNFDHT
jgi:hypothetical protein